MKINSSRRARRKTVYIKFKGEKIKENEKCRIDANIVAKVRQKRGEKGRKR